GDACVDLSAVFSWSYRTLGTAAARMFRLLSLHPGPDISLPAAASLAGTGREQARMALSELARAQLLAETGSDRFACHDLLRAYSAETAHQDENEHARHAALRRMLDHYLHTAHAAALLLDPFNDQLSLAAPQPRAVVGEFADGERAWQWFAAERPVFPGVVDRATDAGFDTHVWQFACSVAEFCIRDGHWTQTVAAQLAAIAAAEHAGDPHGQARSLRELGRAYIRLGRYPDARASAVRALALDESLGDPLGQARSHTVLGVAAYLQDDYQNAIEHDEIAYELFGAVGHRAGQADALNGIGWMQTKLGRHAEALRYCTRALELQQTAGNSYGEAHTWDSLGCIHHNLGEHQRAVACYHAALDLYRKVGTRHPQAYTVIRLGDTHQAAGDTHAAHHSWHQALAILDDLHHPDADDLRARLIDHPPAS
ncbi:tetratricopeptide repeat protein, partial [Amycolatopsis sp. NPDC000673]